MAFLRWLLTRHDLAFSPTLLEHARRDQERAVAQQRRAHAEKELVRSVQARATAQDDLNGPGHRLARQVLAQAAASTAAAERKTAAIRAEHAAHAAAVARARRRR